MLNLKRVGRKVSPNFKVLSQHLPGRTEEKHEKSQNSRTPDRDLNPGSPEYEKGMLI
jgi:hypothetical protein